MTAAINDDLVKILTNEQHARSLLKKANSLAIIGGAATPAGQMAPVFSSSGVGSLVFNNSTGVSKLLADYLALQQSQAKTPAADGINQKPRWMNAKGDQLYEWNTFTGKMETYKPGHSETELTPIGKSEPVWVVESVIDPATGLYGITLPDKDGKQGRTVLISPLKHRVPMV